MNVRVTKRSPLIDAFSNYLRYERNYSEQTIGAYERDLEQFESFAKRNRESGFVPREIDPDFVRCWIVHLMDDKEGGRLSPRSVNRKLSSLKSFFKYLMKQGVVEASPLRLVRGPKASQPLPYFIKDADLEALLDGDSFSEDFKGVRDRLIIEMFYDTGMRRSELAGLRDEDFDFGAMQVKVTGKRDKQRLIPFAEGLAAMTRHYMTIRDREVGRGSEKLFVRPSGKPMTGQDVYNVVREHLSDIPMLAKRSPHVLRHSFATSMLNNGAELNAVKDLLGHSSLASTSVYTHTTFEELKKVYHAHPRAQKEGGNYGD